MATILAQDTFVRANQSAWGAASDGTNSWTEPQGGTSWNVTGNFGEFGTTGTATYILGTGTATGIDVSTKVFMSDSSANSGPLVRANSTGTQGYLAYLHLGNLRIAYLNGSTTAVTLNSIPITLTYNAFVHIRLKVITNADGYVTLYAKAWQDGTSEPALWTLTIIDASKHYSGSGRYGLWVFPDSTTLDGCGAILVQTVDPFGVTSTPPTEGQGIYDEQRTSDGVSVYGPRLAQMAAGGFKFVMNYGFLFGHTSDLIAYINTAASYGMKVIAALGDPVLYNGSDWSVKYPELAADSGCPHTDGACLVSYVISQIKTLPGLWGYYVGDEVVAALHTQLKAHADNIKAQDSTHPRLYIGDAAANESCWRNTSPFNDCCEVIGDDWYPIGDPSLLSIGYTEPQTAQIAAGVQLYANTHGLDSAIVLQPFDEATVLGLTPPVWPTAAQMADMYTQAVGNMTPRMVLWYGYWLVTTVPPAPSTQWNDTIAAFAPTLTVYTTNTNDTLVTTARQLVSTTGATSTNHFDSKCGTSTGYSEMYSQGTTQVWASLAALGPPSGHGFIWDDTSLEQMQISAGNWTPRVRAKVSNGTLSVDMYMRAFVRSSDGTYTQIGSDMALTGQTVTTTSTNFDFSSVSQPSVTFDIGDKAYFDIWFRITANSSGSSSATVGIVEAISSTQGNPSSCTLATPGYQNQPATVTDTSRLRVMIRSKNTQAVGLRTVVQTGIATVTSTVGLRLAVLSPTILRTRAAPIRIPVITGTQGTPSVGLRLVVGLADERTLLISIGGQDVVFAEDTFAISQKVDEAWRCQFTVLDYTGGMFFAYRSRVVVTDTNRGRLFSGEVIEVKQDKSNTSTDVAIEHQIDAIGNESIAGRITSNRLYRTPTFAGKIVVDLLSDGLAAEGVTAPYASDTDETAADFAQGVLTGVTAQSQGLTLTSAGTLFSQTETDGVFATGTLTNVTQTGTALALSSSAAIKMQGTAATAIGGNLYTYFGIWTGSVAITIGDYITYDLWISSSSPKIMGGPDLVCTDGSTLRDSGALDQFQMSVHPKADLSGFANDQWFSRVIAVPSAWPGKTVSLASVALEGDDGGTYTLYVRHFKLFQSNGTLKQTFFETTLANSHQLQQKGYYNTSLNVVTAYQQSGTRLSPAYDISGAGIARDSLIEWTETDPTSSTSTQQAPVLIESSWDGGATFQACTNHDPLVGLLAGMNLSSKHLMLRETLSIVGSSPEVSPTLNELVVQITPSYAFGKSDKSDSSGLTGGLTGGTLTNITLFAGSGLQISGARKTWDDGNVTTGVTAFGTATPAISCWERSLALRTGGFADAKVRFDFAGTWANFIAEIDIRNPAGNVGCDYGLIYRTTTWTNPNDTYAYNARLSSIGVGLYRASNGGASAPVLLATAGLALTDDDWYHFKVIVAGSSHQIFVNGAPLVSVTDGTYTAAGFLGVRVGNASSTVRQSGMFDNFGVMSSALTGTRLHPVLSLSAVGVVTSSLVQWNASVPSNGSLLVESSLDGGSTWQLCTNGGAIPLLPPGTNASGQSLLLRETYTTLNANTSPTLIGLTVYVVGQYSASGTRISPKLDLSPVRRVGSTLVEWDADVPPNTMLAVAVSPDGTSWTDITANGGGSLPSTYLYAQPNPWLDFFGGTS